MKTRKICILSIVVFIAIGASIIMPEPQLKYPLDPQSKKVIERTMDEFLKDKVFDTVWNDFFHYFTNFDSMEGSTGDNTFENIGSANVTLDGWEVAVEADITTDSFMQKVQIPTLGASGVQLNRNLSWGGKQRFRANFSFYDSTVPASPKFTAYIVRGATPQSNYDHPHFGFKIVDTTLYGVSRNNAAGGETTVELQDLNNGEAYFVEARYLPGQKVIFSVEDKDDFIMKEKGIITADLPNPTNTNIAAFYGFEISRVDNHTVQLLGSFFEYQQERIRGKR